MSIISPEQAIEFFKNAAVDLKSHCDSIGRAVTGSELRYGAPAAGKIQVQMWWTRVPSPVAPEFLWDEANVTIEESQDPELVALNLAVGAGLALSDIPATQSQSRKRLASSVPMFAIHPQRFRALHPMGATVARMAYSFQEPWRAFTKSSMETMQQLYIGTAQPTDNTRLRPRLMSSATDPRAEMMSSINLAMFSLAWNIAGRQIFQFPKKLMDMFTTTDVEDIPMDMIKFPYDAMYLAFGPRADLSPKEGWSADGVYVFVTRHPNDPSELTTVQFALTFAPDDPQAYTELQNDPEPVFVMALKDEGLRLGIGEACDLEVSDRISELRKQVAGNTDFARNFPRDEGMVNGQSRAAARELERLPRLQKCWSGMLKLTVNALAYLSAYPDDIDTSWPANTPKALLERLGAEKAKHRQRAESELTAGGFTQIRLCGKTFARNTEQSSPAEGSQSDAPPTWVRGHWTKQAFGPRHSLRRLQWIMPYVRNRDNEADNTEMGHIYHVDVDPARLPEGSDDAAVDASPDDEMQRPTGG